MKHHIHEGAPGHLTRGLLRGAPRLEGRTWTLAVHLVAALVLTGCISPIDNSQHMAVNEKPPRPGHIMVHDFAATTADIPSDAPMGARISAGGSLPPEQIAMDRRLGSDMTTQLIAAIREMGLPAERAVPGATSHVNDIVIQGYLASTHEDGAASRFTLGFYAGASELTAVVESFQITAQGVGRRLDVGTATAGGSKTPGSAVGAATVPARVEPAGFIVASGIKTAGEASDRPKLEGWAREAVKEIAGRLKTTFEKQGWIN